MKVGMCGEMNFIFSEVVRSPRKPRQRGEEQVITIAELLEARGEIAQLETLKKRAISEDELMPILHNRRVAVQEIEQELREDYKEKFPKWLNAEDLEALCLFIVTANLFEHYSYEWLQYNKPKKAIQYLRTAKTFLEKAIAEFTEQLPLEEKLRLVREATRRIENI